MAWWRQLHLSLRKWIIAATVILAGITMVINFIIVYGAALGPSFAFLDTLDAALRPYFSKESLPWPRLALFMVWFGAGFWLFSRYEDVIIRRLGWLLMPFGTNSLYVYTIHAVLIFGIHLVISTTTSSPVVNLALSIGAVLIISLCIRYKVLMKIIPR